MVARQGLFVGTKAYETCFFSRSSEAVANAWLQFLEKTCRLTIRHITPGGLGVGS